MINLDSKKLLSLKEVRDQYGVTLYVLRKAINENKLACYKIGNTFMVFEKDVDLWIQACRTQCVWNNGGKA